MTQLMTKAVIATVAADRPGLVSELSELVHGLDLNIEDSRMTVLGGEFAVLMSVSGADAALDALERQLMARTNDGFAVLFRRTAERTQQATERCLVTIESMDHPGIVHGVAAFFGSRGVNIAELNTDTERAPHTGAPVFNLEMEIEVPASVPIDELGDAFRRYCEAEGLDGDISRS